MQLHGRMKSLFTQNYKNMILKGKKKVQFRALNIAPKVKLECPFKNVYIV